MVGAGLTVAATALVILSRLSAQSQPPFDLIIRNGRIVHGDGRITTRASVLVRSGVIVHIEPISGERAAGDEAPARREIDAAGRTMMPGLIDAHVHADTWTLPVFLKYGVTTVRDLHNDAAFIFPLAKDENSRRPRIVTSGPSIDGVGSFLKNAVEVSTVGEARAAVRSLVEQGARIIKVHARLGPALMSVVASEARARGIPVAAHVGLTTATQAADAGVTSLEHLSGVADAASDESERLLKAHQDFLGGWTASELEWRRVPLQRLEGVARQLIERGVVVVPTLALHEAVSRMADADLLQDPTLAEVPTQVLRDSWDPADICRRAHWTPQTLAQFKQVLPILQSFVGIYARLGGRIAAGTDAPQQFVVPGVSLHRELELYVGSGLSPAQALKTATVEAATLLGIQDRVGTIAAGNAADLILLDGDPLADIRNTRRIWAVIKDGVVIQGPGIGDQGRSCADRAISISTLSRVPDP